MMMMMMERCIIVIGNGPSKKLLLERGITKWKSTVSACTIIGCNQVYNGVAAIVPLDLLLVADVWCQFDVVRDEYPAKNRCKFVRWNPMPIEVYSEEFVQSMCPDDYEVIEHNPEQRKYADSWMFYATSKEDFETAKGAIGYWKPNCGYLCWIPAGYQIDIVEMIDSTTPTGAYALREAINGKYDKIEIYGFDSIAGNFKSSTENYYEKHEENKMGLDFIKWYDIIMKDCPKTTEVIWHTL